MSSPGLRPYNGSVVRKKRRKWENKAVLCDYVRTAASSSKSVTPLRPPRLVLYRALAARSNQSAGVDTPEPGAAPALIAMAARPVRIMVVSSFSTGLLIVFTERRAARAQMPSKPAIIRKISVYSVLKIIPRIVRAVTLPSGRQVV